MSSYTFVEAVTFAVPPPRTKQVPRQTSHKAVCSLPLMSHDMGHYLIKDSFFRNVHMITFPN
jgi:hypothetical protein